MASEDCLFQLPTDFLNPFYKSSSSLPPSMENFCVKRSSIFQSSFPKVPELFCSLFDIHLLVLFQILAIQNHFFIWKWKCESVVFKLGLFANPLTIARQAPLSTEFSRQEYWNGLPFRSPGDLLNPGTEHGSPTMQADSLPPEPLGKPLFSYHNPSNIEWLSKYLSIFFMGIISTLHRKFWPIILRVP